MQALPGKQEKTADSGAAGLEGVVARACIPNKILGDVMLPVHGPQDEKLNSKPQDYSSQLGWM